MGVRCRVPAAAAAPPATSGLLNSGGLLGWTEQGFGRFPCLWGSVSQGHVMGTRKIQTSRSFLTAGCRCLEVPSVPSLAMQPRSKPVSHSRRRSPKPSWAYGTPHAREQLGAWRAAGERGTSAVVPLGCTIPRHVRSWVGLWAVTQWGWLSMPLAWH